MKRLVASLVMIAFVVGMLVLPTLHRLHCNHDQTHRESDCPVCQLANAPLETTDTNVGVINAPPPVENISDPCEVAFVAPASHDATQARAPPVA